MVSNGLTWLNMVSLWLIYGLSTIETTPLKNMSQLGGWHSQYMESHKIPWFQTTNQNCSWLTNNEWLVNSIFAPKNRSKDWKGRAFFLTEKSDVVGPMSD